MSLKSNLNSLYDPLLNKDELDGDSDNGSESQYQPAARNRRLLLNKRASIPIWMIATVAFLQVVTLFLLVKGGFKKNSCDYPNPQVLYSPVQDLVEYEVVKFRSGLNGEGDDIYSSPPSDEVDAAWEGLYNFGVSEISEQQALQLANVTMEVPNSDNKYVMLLDVFHELHCINMIRMALYPQHYYNSTDPMGESKRRTHVNHCLNSLRQSVQCSSDISTIVWNKPEGEREGPRFDIIHSCRNFEKIRSWAGNNRGSIFVKDGRISATAEGFKDDMSEMDHHHGHHHHDG